MVGKTISRCRLLDKLGGGGMSVVYKAEDTKLDRLLGRLLGRLLTRIKIVLEEMQL